MASGALVWVLVLVALPVCVSGTESLVDSNVVLIDEAPQESKELPYGQWASEAQALESKVVPALPKDPESTNPQSELLHWSLKTGLDKDLLRAKGEYARHDQKMKAEQAEVERKRNIELVESNVMEKAKQDVLKEKTEPEEKEPPAISEEELQAAKDKAEALKFELEAQKETIKKAKAKDEEEMMAAVGDLAKPNADLFIQLSSDSAKTSVHAKQGSNLHRAASTTVHAKHGSDLHKSSKTSVHMKNSGEARFYAKKHGDLHKNDPAYDANTVPTSVEQAAREQIEKWGHEVAEKFDSDDQAFNQYADAVIASAVSGAGPKLAELTQKANVKAAIEKQDANAKMNTMAEPAKKEENSAADNQ